MHRFGMRLGSFGLLVMLCLVLVLPARGVEHAALGISVRPVSPQYAEFIGLEKPYGAQVVAPGAGGVLQAGDLIVMINETRIHSPADLPQALRTKLPGDRVQMQIMRGREHLTIHHMLKAVAVTGVSARTGQAVQGAAGLGSFPTVSSEHFQEEVLQSDQPVLAYFYANWCAPCKTYLPIMQQVSQQHPDVKIVGVDVDSSRDIVKRYGISGILPAVILFNGGQEVDKVMPVSRKELVDALLDKLQSDKLELFATQGREGWIHDLAFIPGSTLIAARNHLHTIFVWDYQQGSSHWIYRSYISALAPNGMYAAQSDKKQQRIILINNLSKQYQTIATDQFIEQLAVSPNGTAVACFGLDRTGRYGVTVWGSNNRLITTVPVDSGNHFQSVQFAFSSDGATFALSSRNKLEFFDATTWERKTLVQRSATARVLQFTSDNQAVLVLGGQDELIDLQGLRKPWGNGRVVRGQTDGRLFATTHGDNTFSLAGGPSSAPAVRFIGHRAPISMAAVSDTVPWLASGSSDGTVRLWDRATGEEIAQFVGFYNGEWMVVTPEGYYNSSPQGHELLSVRKGGKVFGVDQFYDVFYRPDIVTAKLKGEDLGGLITLTVDEAIRHPPPQVTFTTVPGQSSDNTVKLCYQVQSTGGGIGEVRLFQNAKLVKSDGFYREAVIRPTTNPLRLAGLNSRAVYQDMRSLAVKEKQGPGSVLRQAKGELVRECVELEAIAGENEIGLTAFNASNSVQSRMVTARFISTRQAAEPHLYILAVGVDRYRDASVNLKYAAKDAKDFGVLLSEKAKSIYKPSNIHLITLVDEQASKQQILTTIEGLAGQVQHGDSFIFFNASHGLLLQNQYYIVTSSFNGGLDSSASLISSNEIVEVSKKIRALSQLFIFDTCHAGGVDSIVSGLYDARMSVLAKKMGLHIYASAGSMQTALDGYLGNGLYTHALLEGIQNGRRAVMGQSGTVTVKSLGGYSKQLTSQLSERLGHPQTPLIISFGKDSRLFEAH